MKAQEGSEFSSRFKKDQKAPENLAKYHAKNVIKLGLSRAKLRPRLNWQLSQQLSRFSYYIREAFQTKKRGNLGKGPKW